MSSAYGLAQLYKKQAVLTTSPGHLVLMLYDGALKFLDQAQDALNLPEETPQRIERINTALTKAQNILYELQSNLDHDAGGDYSASLDRLYDYYLRRILDANLRKDIVPVIEVERLLRQLRDGWAEMLRKQENENQEGARGVA